MSNNTSVNSKSPIYEKPMITRLNQGAMNKFGSNPYYARKVRKEIEGVAIDDLCQRHGSPLFVFSEKSLRQKYQEMYRAFSTRYQKVQMSWSYKTNYLSAICGVFHQEGAIAEVVSEMEYQKARHFGMPGNKIIFNGPLKSDQILQQAVNEGAIINIDHLDEMVALEKIARQLGKVVPVGIRLNLDAGIYPQWSRFGFNLESGQAFDALKRMSNNGQLQLQGLHCHIGTFILDPLAYVRQVEKMIDFAYEVEDRLGYRLEYLDIGGGFPSRSNLKGTYLPPDIAIQPVDDYAEKICNALYEKLRPGHLPTLYLESGRHLVDEAGYLITSVHASKRLNDGRKAYIMDAGLNLLYTSQWYKFNLELDRDLQGLNEPAVLYGPLCMNIDVIDEGCLLPIMPNGTRLVVSPVGAYNVTQWMQFIQYRPAIVMVCTDGSVEVIRRAENLDDMQACEVLPARFAGDAQ